MHATDIQFHPKERGFLEETPAPSLGHGLPSRAAHLVELTRRALDACAAGIGLLGADGSVQEFLPTGLSTEEARALLDSGWPTKLISLILRQPLPIRVPDLPDTHCDYVPPTMAIQPIRSLLGVPIFLAGRRGAMYFFRGPEARPFTPEDEEIVVPLVSWLGDGGWSGEARLLNQLTMLNRIAQHAASQLDLDDLFRIALKELDRYFPMSPCAVWLIEDDAKLDESRSGASPHAPCKLVSMSPSMPKSSQMLPLAPGLQLSQSQTIFADCLAHGEAQYADLGNRGEQGASSTLHLQSLLAEMGATCCFSVPLRAGERTLGVLQSICLRPMGFTAEQIQLLYRVADLLGPATSNCQLFARLKGAYAELNQTQTQLIQAEKLRALGELASGMAHEFNNALCGVLGFLELALCGANLDPACRHHLELARTCSQDAAQTVRRMQDFARQRRGEQQVVPVELDAIVRETLELARHKWEGFATRSPISVEINTLSQAVVMGNAFELREVLTNLIFNAVDAMPHGGVLSVRTWALDGNAFFSVRDTGVGMSEDVRKRVFEPFFTTKGERGNGLGLSVTFAVVRRHGGTIKVESNPGHGTAFTVQLPRGAGKPAPATPVGVPSHHGTPGRLRILVVEDEEPVRQFLALALREIGHDVRQASDGHDGLNALAEERFDVVMTDMGMPGITGKDIIRAVSEKQPGTPVLLLTGWGEQIRHETPTMAGVAKILDKPISLATLITALADVSKSRVGHEFRA